MTPYQQGRQDYCDDMGSNDNPYQHGTQDARDWYEGWRDCYDEDNYDGEDQDD